MLPVTTAQFRFVVLTPSHLTSEVYTELPIDSFWSHRLLERMQHHMVPQRGPDLTDSGNEGTPRGRLFTRVESSLEVRNFLEESDSATIVGKWTHCSLREDPELLLINE